MTDGRLENWARQVADASPELDAEQRRIAIETYHLLAQGRPITESDIADATGIPGEKVEESLHSWPLVLRDDRDRIVGFWGLHVDHIEPTHAMDVDGTRVYGWCAWDTLFITEILGLQTRIESTDPHDGTPIRLTVNPDEVVSLQPPEAVVSILHPDEHLGEDTIQRFCHQIYFFSSPQSAEQWMADRPGIFAITVEEAFRAGKLTNRLRLGIEAVTDDPIRTS